MTTRTTVTAMIAVLMYLAIGTRPIAIAQEGSGSSRSDPARATRPQTPDEFYNSFWRFIVKRGAAYNTWKVLSRGEADDGIENPHSSISKTYVDKVGAADTEALPNESILVREDYDREKNRQSISVMYRVKDYDKEHGNWYWIKYLEDGSVARGVNNKALAGKVASCIECHAKAKGNDFVFSNDGVVGDKKATSDKTKE